MIADLMGKAGHVRTMPTPAWVNAAIDEWKAASGVTQGAIFRSINKNGRVRGNGMTARVLWEVIRDAASKAGIAKLAPHDLRRYAPGYAILPAANWSRSNSCWECLHPDY